MNKNLTNKFAPGHSTCAGCGIPAIVRTVLGATDDPVVVINATGCLEVTSTLYPYSSWKVPFIHNAFENAGATASGVETAYKALVKRGKIPKRKKIKFVAFGGDGGTYDIGLQSLSGALERGHQFLYVCYDNEGYMNTGGQRSGATPYGADTETTPAGRISFGKGEKRKDLMSIVIAHHIRYAAQSNAAYLRDLEMKAKKAFEAEGPSFLLVLQPCTNLWKYPTSEYVRIGKLATETNFWPLYEYENGKYKINWATENPKPIEEFIKTQGRFKHLFKPGNEEVIKEIQKEIRNNWEELVNLAEV
ncbi:MAG: thiamine pyrophosphate-dependent enzyme [Parcubacteria group bacterium]|jgi:pyruvate ferredoxin oxidoreductase beta subunit